MSELLDLLDAGPMIALAIACVLMVSVVVVVVLQARRISRLERQLAERGEAAEDAPLRRIAELQARHEATEGGVGSSVALRPALLVGAVALVMVLAVGGAWMFLTGADDGSGASPQADAAGQTTTAGTTRTGTAPDPVAATTVPASVPPIADTSQFSVAVFNASGVPGAAGDGVTPRLQTEGYQVPITANYPNEETGLQQSVVMYNGSENQAAAWNIAQVLGITRTPPLEGLTVDQIGGADVVVVVGLDIAESVVSSQTP
jgi:hypothetical protein